MGAVMARGKSFTSPWGRRDGTLLHAGRRGGVARTGHTASGDRYVVAIIPSVRPRS
jgi:hypothetical protein